MWFEKDIGIEVGMSEAVEGGAVIAWRLLATLEGGSLLLATSALLAYTVRKKIAGHHRTGRNIRRVLVTNTTNLLGRELRKRLEERGCEVDTVNRDASRASNGTVSGASNGTLSAASTGTVSGASNGTVSGASNGTVRGASNGTVSGANNRASGTEVDAIVVVGAEPKADDLDGMASLVTEDVYHNLKLLESLSSRVRRGGCIAWACAGDAGGAGGAFSDAGAAFDTVLRASLQHVAKLSHCEPIWVGRCEGAEQAAERVVAALLTRDDTTQASGFSVRYTVHRVGECLYRWLKKVT